LAEVVVRMGLIGCGGMGRSLAENAAGLSGCEVVAVSDPDEERGRPLSSDLGCDYEPNHENLIRRDDMDSVLIATPPFLHEAPAVAAAESGKHVFCEKPLAPSLASCDRIIEAAEANGVALGVGLVCRYHPVHAEVARLVKTNDLGPAMCMSVHRLSGGDGGAWQVPWRLERSKSGGNLMEINAHEIDFMRNVMGDAVSVYAVGDTYRQLNQDYPDLAVVSMTFESGAVGSLHSSNANTSGGYGGRVDCVNGSIVFPSFRGEGGGLTIQGRDEPSRFIPAEELKQEKDPVAQEIDAFVRAIQSGETPPVGGREGRAATEIALAAYTSIETGQPVQLPLSEE